MFRKVIAGEFGSSSVTVVIDGQAVTADEGEAIAAVLLRVPPFTSRTTPVHGTNRAPFCMMGACFDCLVQIDGQTSLRSCMALARQGMVIKRQIGRPDPSRGQFT